MSLITVVLDQVVSHFNKHPVCGSSNQDYAMWFRPEHSTV